MTWPRRLLSGVKLLVVRDEVLFAFKVDDHRTGSGSRRSFSRVQEAHSRLNERPSPERGCPSPGDGRRAKVEPLVRPFAKWTRAALLVYAVLKAQEALLPYARVEVKS